MPQRGWSLRLPEPTQDLAYGSPRRSSCKLPGKQKPGSTIEMVPFTLLGAFISKQGYNLFFMSQALNLCLLPCFSKWNNTLLRNIYIGGKTIKKARMCLAWKYGKEVLGERHQAALAGLLMPYFLSRRWMSGCLFYYWLSMCVFISYTRTHTHTHRHIHTHTLSLCWELSQCY